MKKLVALGLFVATVAVAGTVFADDGSLQDQKLQELFAWSAEAGETTKSVASYEAYPGYRAPEQAVQLPGSVVEASNPVPPYQVYPGFEVN